MISYLSFTFTRSFVLKIIAFPRIHTRCCVRRIAATVARFNGVFFFIEEQRRHKRQEHGGTLYYPKARKKRATSGRGRAEIYAPRRKERAVSYSRARRERVARTRARFVPDKSLVPEFAATGRQRFA